MTPPSEDQTRIAALRRGGMSSGAIAAMFGISPGQVSAIAAGAADPQGLTGPVGPQLKNDFTLDGVIIPPFATYAMGCEGEDGTGPLDDLRGEFFAYGPRDPFVTQPDCALVLKAKGYYLVQCALTFIRPNDDPPADWQVTTRFIPVPQEGSPSLQQRMGHRTDYGWHTETIPVVDPPISLRLDVTNGNPGTADLEIANSQWLVTYLGPLR